MVLSFAPDQADVLSVWGGSKGTRRKPRTQPLLPGLTPRQPSRGVRSPPTFGSSSSGVLHPLRGEVTFPELNPEPSSESNSLWPTWAGTEGTQSLRSTAVHSGTDRGPEGPG